MNWSPFTRARQDRTWRLLIPPLAWAAFIALTSSTVVTPRAFFDWISVNLFTSDETFQQFVGFWGVSWFAIVKSWHALEFAVLFLLLLMAHNCWWKSSPRRNLVVAATIAVLFAMTDEYHQTFVPERGGTWIDVGIDSIGIGCAAAVAWRFSARRAKLS